jgi:hypothetical protein
MSRSSPVPQEEHELNAKKEETTEEKEVLNTSKETEKYGNAENGETCEKTTQGAIRDP